MRIVNLASLLAPGIVFMSLAACGGAGPSLSADPGWAAALDELKGTVSASTGYPAAAIKLLASPAHVRVSISDSRLAQADQATRENAATAVVAALEKSMASNTRFASVVAVSVAIIHAPEGSARGSHVEDVVDFRKGPNQRFALHIT
ncbi:MAG TPA: hypothetical protein VEU78_10125 [Steroidobacteraceae bacterium]|nr:hypothetical protein [Steroidobacteraceae bacterium]